MADAPVKNKEYTMQKLLNAVEDILREEGHQRLGVNRIAQKAGVSKALMYRYFGGMDGLIRAYGETDSFWPSADEIRGMSADAFKELPLKDRCRRIFRNFRLALKKRPHTVAVYAWEMVEPHDIARNIIAERTQHSLDVVKEMMGQSHKELTGYDHEITAMIGAALLHLVMRESLGAPFAGLDLDDQTTWDRFDAALETLFVAAEVLYTSRTEP
jgi:AcrR family transcriptional regulator